MSQSKPEAVRLLSFDGGDLGAVSQLLILDEFMRRLEWDTKSETRILPCEYFHMMAGVGTGGIIVTLLSILRMNVEEAIEEFISIWQAVYADDSLDRATRSAKLEETLHALLKRKDLEKQNLRAENGGYGNCKTFLCATPESNLGLCSKFRNYESREMPINLTIVQAVRATCAIPTLFTPVSIESVGCRTSYITGCYNFNNPAWELIKEACEHFGKNRPVATLLSLGCGRRPTLRIHESLDGNKLGDLMDKIISDCGLVENELGWRLGKSNVYYRLSVDHESMNNSPAFQNHMENIVSCTKAFLEHHDTVDMVNQCLVACEEPGSAILAEISGLSERISASAHGLPSLSAFFVERPVLIKEMAQCMFQVGPGAQRRMVLSGLGGIGKTQITISFLLQFLSRFRHILFIDGSSEQRIESGIISKVKFLGATYSRTTWNEALEVLANPDHEVTREWVIVYDNVDDPKIQIAQYFPRCAFGTIIITTRNPNLGNLALKAHLKLDVMSEEESIDVLLQSAIDPLHKPTNEDHRHARDISKALGYLPVALVQAGYFIKQHDCMHDYIRRLKVRRPQILNRPAEAQLDSHYHGIYAALDVTWPNLSPRTQEFLGILAFVNYTGFPLVLVHRAAVRDFAFEPFNFAERPPEFQRSIQLLRKMFRPLDDWDEMDIEDLVVELEQYSLLSRVPVHRVTTLRLHPLVHCWIHDRMPSVEREMYRSAAVRLLVCVTSSDDEDIFEFLYPHVTLLHDHLYGLHVNDRAALSAIYEIREDNTMSIEVWERVWKELIELYGKNDLRTTDAKLQLASVYRKLGNASQKSVAPLMEGEVVGCRSWLFGPSDPRTVKAIFQQARQVPQNAQESNYFQHQLRIALGFWEMQMEDHWTEIMEVKEALATSGVSQTESINLLTEVVKEREKRKGMGHHTTLKAMERLAQAHSGVDSHNNTTQQTSTIEAWTSVVDARTKKRGVRHLDTLAAMESLALSYYLQNDLEMSEKLYKQVANVRKEVQGPSHKDTLETMLRLANICANPLQFEEAETLWKEMIATRKQAHGPSHKDTLDTMLLLVNFYTNLQKFEEAEILWKEMIAARKQIRGPSYKDTFGTMLRLANIYANHLQSEEADILWREMIATGTQVHGPTHETTLYAMERLVEIHIKRGFFDNAETRLKEIITIRQGAQDFGHSNVLEAMERLANLYVRNNKLDKAGEQWKDIIKIRKNTQGSSNRDTLDAMRRLADIYDQEVSQQKEGIPPWSMRGSYFRQNEAKVAARRVLMKAVTLWEEVIVICKGTYGLTHGDTLKAMERLVDVYQKACKLSEVTVPQQEAIAIRKDAQGFDYSDTLHAVERLPRIYAEIGQIDKAAAQWKDVIAIREELQGFSHSDTLHAMECLAEFYDEDCQFPEADEQWAEIIAIRKEVQGSSHSDTLNAMNKRASFYAERSLFDHAEEKWTEVISIRKEVQGFSHSDTLHDMECLANFYDKNRLFHKAEEQWTKIIAIRKEVQGADHEVTLHAMLNLVNVYESSLQLKKAKILLREAMNIWNEAHKFNPSDPSGGIMAGMFLSLSESRLLTEDSEDSDG